MARYPTIVGNRLWVADSQLARYEIQAEPARLVPRQISDRGYVFLQPLTVIGRAICHVRQKPGMPGVTVSAIDLEKHEPIWQTCLAAPQPGEPMVDGAGGKLTAVTANGGMFQFEAAAIRGHAATDEPLIAVETSRLLQPISTLLPITGGMFAMTSGPGTKQIIVYDPKSREKQFRWLVVPEAMACEPIALAGGILVPSSTGQVFLLDLQSTENLARPLVPSFKSVTAWKWRCPDVLDTKDVVLSDGDKRLFLAQVKNSVKNSVENPAEAALIETGDAMTERPVASRLAVAGRTVYMVDTRGTALTFDLPALTPGKQHALAGLCTWGPRRVGQQVLLATDKDRLYCFNDRQELLWETALPYGPLAGAPIAAGEHYLLASQSGVVWRITAAGGKELGKVDVGCPLGTGPVLMADRLFVGGRDGTLNEVRRP